MVVSRMIITRHIFMSLNVFGCQYEGEVLDMLFSVKYGYERANMEDRPSDYKKCHFFVSNSTHNKRILVAMASIH